MEYFKMMHQLALSSQDVPYLVPDPMMDGFTLINLSHLNLLNYLSDLNLQGVTTRP